jgi:hypothetical protein
MPPRRKVITGHPGYVVGDDGSVLTWWALNPGPRKLRLQAPREITPNLHGGYPRVSIDRTHCLVHVLVLEAFVGLCPPGMECRHLDGNKTNCRLSNLAWGTRQENMADRTRLNEHGNKSRPGEIHGRAKLTEDNVRMIRKLHRHRTYRALATQFHVSMVTIKGVVTGKTWKHLETLDD